MNRRYFLRALTIAGLALSPAIAVPVLERELPLGEWLLAVQSPCGNCAWLMLTNGDFVAPHYLPKWICRLKLSNTGHTNYSEISAKTFAEAKEKLLDQHRTWFITSEDYTPGPWLTGSELASDLGWDRNW